MYNLSLFGNIYGILYSTMCHGQHYAADTMNLNLLGGLINLTTNCIIVSKTHKLKLSSYQKIWSYSNDTTYSRSWLNLKCCKRKQGRNRN